jgi:hypothetical protein
MGVFVPIIKKHRYVSTETRMTVDLNNLSMPLLKKTSTNVTYRIIYALTYPLLFFHFCLKNISTGVPDKSKFSLSLFSKKRLYASGTYWGWLQNTAMAGNGVGNW